MPSGGPRRPRRHRRAALTALAGLSALLLAAGTLLASVARPTAAATTTVDVPAGATAPLLVLAPDLLASRPGPVVVRATGEGPVLVAVGSGGDVAAWARGAATTTATSATGSDGGDTAAVSSGDGEQQVPDLAGSDLWTAQAGGTGSAELVLDPAAADVPATPAVLVAADGTAPAPGAVQLTWSHRPVPAAAVVLLGAGALLALALLVPRLRAARPRADRRPRGRRRSAR